MGPRIGQPAVVVPGAMEALIAFGDSAVNGSVPRSTIELVKLRASQINGCSFCVDMHSRDALKDGDSAQRLFAVAAWRETDYFSDAERAALALTEATTRLADRGEAVSDEVWAEAARHYDEKGLASLVVAIAAINAWNRLNAATHQPAAPLRG